jgi:hypothetical protein
MAFSKAPWSRWSAADRCVVLLVVAFAQFDSQTAGLQEELLAVGMGGNDRAIPGRLRPRASVRQFIELAVNMPEQEPQVGQAERSISSRSPAKRTHRRP